MASQVFKWSYRCLLQARLVRFRPIGGGRGLSEAPPTEEKEGGETTNSKSWLEDPYQGISTSVFPESVVKLLLASVNETDIELKPDGLIYLPEIKYRRILNQAFGPGGWALMPRGDTLHFQNETEGAQLITREYALYCHGRFIAQATGEHVFYGKSNLQYGKACESAKSNALMRCCKDLGIASELWDPQFTSQWRQQHAKDVWCENQRTREKKRLWKKKNRLGPFPYPWKELGSSS